MAAMTHQEVFQQHIIINQLIRGRLRWERGARVRRKAASREIYDQIMVELRKEDHRTFKISSATQNELLDDIFNKARVWKSIP